MSGWRERVAKQALVQKETVPEAVEMPKMFMVRHLERIDDPSTINSKEYKEWLQKWYIYYISLDDLSDTFTTAEIISKTLKDRLILCKEVWYMLDKKNLWKQQKEPSFYIIEELRKYIDASQLRTAYKISKSEGDDKEKFSKINKGYLASYSGINSSSTLSP